MLSSFLPESLAIYVGGPHGVLHLVYWTSGITFVIGQTVAMLALLRTRPARVAADASTALEAVWACVPAVILIVLGMLSSRAADGTAQPPEVGAMAEVAAQTKGLRER
jgi:heme/copper-type cytochrome/quinol oxidase subunit 2